MNTSAAIADPLLDDLRDMVLAWVATLPASALLACIAYLIFSGIL